MKIIKFAVLLFLFLSVCGCDSCVKPHEPSVAGSDSASIEAKDIPPEYIICDSSMIDGYIAYFSADMPLDISAGHGFFPFAIADSAGRKNMFVLFFTSRYDKLYVSQMRISDKSGHIADMMCISPAKQSGETEYVVFAADSDCVRAAARMDSDIVISVWGDYGSAAVKLTEKESGAFAIFAGFCEK